MSDKTKFISQEETIEHFDYSDAEKKEIAERVIQLESIGHAYDDLTGFVYPVYADGTLDYNNFVLTGEIEKENGISDEDWKIIADCPV